MDSKDAKKQIGENINVDVNMEGMRNSGLNVRVLQSGVFLNVCLGSVAHSNFMLDAINSCM